VVLEDDEEWGRKVEKSHCTIYDENENLFVPF
jgi:hypothetical protein